MPAHHHHNNPNTEHSGRAQIPTAPADVGAFVTRYVGSEGSTAYEASLTEETEGLVWSMRSETTRFTGTFSDDGTVITGYWELLSDGGEWQRWMDITLTKRPISPGP
jgi:hypothetical protein